MQVDLISNKKNSSHFCFKTPLTLNVFNAKRIKISELGSGCGAVGRAIASNTRDPQFESSHRLYYLLSILLKNCIEKTKIKKKRSVMVQFMKK